MQSLQAGEGDLEVRLQNGPDRLDQSGDAGLLAQGHRQAQIASAWRVASSRPRTATSGRGPRGRACGSGSRTCRGSR